MIKIPICFYCKHCFLEQDEVEEQEEGKLKCEAYPEGIPQLKLDEDDEECVNGFRYENREK